MTGRHFTLTRLQNFVRDYRAGRGWTPVSGHNFAAALQHAIHNGWLTFGPKIPSDPASQIR